MRILLDTQALLSLLLEPSKLSKRARAVVEDPATEAVVSAATAWQIATKHRLGKLDHAGEVVRDYADHLRTAMLAERRSCRSTARTHCSLAASGPPTRIRSID